MSKLVTAVAHNCFCERIESHVLARFTDMRLTGSFQIKVQEDLKIKLPLKSDCECHPVNGAAAPRPTYVPQPTPVPRREEQKPVKAETRSSYRPTSTGSSYSMTPTYEELPRTRLSKNLSQSSLSSTHSSVSAKSVPKTAPKPVTKTHSQTNIFITVRDLPKMDSFLEGGSCDPYYVFKLDGKKVAGGAHIAIINQRHGAWSFKILDSALKTARNIRVEFYDHDSLSKDDLIGSFDCTVSELFTRGGFKNQKLAGKDAKKANVDLTFKHV